MLDVVNGQFGLWLHLKTSPYSLGNPVAYHGKQSNPAIVKNCIAEAAEFHFLIQGSDTQPQKIQHPISWTKPDLGWYKLNMDASVIPSTNCAGGGGLLRESNG